MTGVLAARGSAEGFVSDCFFENPLRVCVKAASARQGELLTAQKDPFDVSQVYLTRIA
jgi:hypothetical protein